MFVKEAHSRNTRFQEGADEHKSIEAVAEASEMHVGDV